MSMTTMMIDRLLHGAQQRGMYINTYIQIYIAPKIVNVNSQLKEMFKHLLQLFTHDVPYIQVTAG